MQIQQSKIIIMDTQVRLSQSMNEMGTVEKQLNNLQVSEQQNQTSEVINTLNNTENMETESMAKNKKEINFFSLFYIFNDIERIY